MGRLLSADVPITLDIIQDVNECQTHCHGISMTEKLKEAVVVDARPPAAYAKHHVDGAVNVPASTKDLATITGLPENKSTPIVCHCAVGGEAMMTIKTLKKAGYTDVTDAGSIGRVEKLEG